jgi:hypothetical protein
MPFQRVNPHSIIEQFQKVTGVANQRASKHNLSFRTSFQCLLNTRLEQNPSCTISNPLSLIHNQQMHLKRLIHEVKQAQESFLG